MRRIMLSAGSVLLCSCTALWPFSPSKTELSDSRLPSNFIASDNHVAETERGFTDQDFAQLDEFIQSGSEFLTEATAVAAMDTQNYDADLLRSLASQFTWDTHSENPRVAKQIQRLLRNPRHLNQILQRSEPLLALVSDRVSEHDLPIELAFLPFIESGYRASAVSHRGAGGLWQFMPNTARHYGMEINWWYDERLDSELSTDKALAYLVYLHNRFYDNWELALAAYNGGESYVSRRLKSLDTPADFWVMPLKKETRDYVPKLLALIEIVASPEKYGVELPKFALESPLTSVSLDNQIDLRQAAAAMDMKYADLRALNADFLRWISPPDRAHSILIPAEKKREFLAVMDKLTTDNQRIWNHYRVREGDTLSEIAGQFGTTLRSLIAVNQLKNTKLKINQELLIPQSELRQVTSIKPSDSIKQLYVVKPGDSLWEIAKSQGVSVAEIKRLNNIRGNLINVGKVLIISETFTGRELVYQVRPGDSLYEIALRFQVAVAELKAWNKLNGNIIKPGQELTIRTSS